MPVIAGDWLVADVAAVKPVEPCDKKCQAVIEEARHLVALNRILRARVAEAVANSRRLRMQGLDGHRPQARCPPIGLGRDPAGWPA